MKFVRQFLIILTVTFLAEIIKFIVPLPSPASIYGLILMFTALATKIIKVEQVKETGYFLIEIMPLMFIPAAVGLMDSFGALKGVVLAVCAIIVITTLFVMVVTGLTTQWLIRLEKRRKP